jgi:hypothetical protein
MAQCVAQTESHQCRGVCVIPIWGPGLSAEDSPGGIDQFEIWNCPTLPKYFTEMATCPHSTICKSNWVRSVQGSLKLGSDMLPYTDVTQFEPHIAPWGHVAISVKYFKRVGQFWISWFLPRILHCEGMWPFLWNISGNFELVDSFHRIFSTGLRASNWDQTCSPTLMWLSLSCTLRREGMWPSLWNISEELGNFEFRIGWFLLGNLQHWAQGLKLGSHMLPYTDLTQFDLHIVPWGHVAISVKYFERVGQFQISNWLIPSVESLALGSGWILYKWKMCSKSLIMSAKQTKCGKQNFQTRLICNWLP